MNNKALTLLGFASKAGKLQFGLQKTNESIKNNKTKLVVTACDVSDKSKKEISFFAHNKNINVVTLSDITIEKLSAAVGRKCGIISVNDGGFADAICNTLGGYANDQ
ncbi:MAG: ribosomal L7Ae/L30e/S12e/Gadd45 family protein [Clostridia bacterium]|nr:ribosomal L7Ae/L30e/S12e/Gadd45 family protein [Clostridia bacterium]